MLTAQNLFDLSDFPDAAVFSNTHYAWEALGNLAGYLEAATESAQLREIAGKISGIPLTEPLIVHNGTILSATGCEIIFGDVNRGQLRVSRGGEIVEGASVIMAGVVLVGGRIQLGRGVLLEAGAFLKEPAIIGDYSEVRQGAYLRGNCLIGQRCVVGHTTEVKNSIFLNDAKAGHFAYLGDSILGSNTNLGAGTKMANLRFLPGEIAIKTTSGPVPTGRRKLGAILGDRSQTGCNSVTNPGTILGPESVLMPNTTAPSGYHHSKSVIR